MWFKELVNEIQNQAKVKLTNRTLIAEMLEFKNRAPLELTESYPSNDAISRRWPSAKTMMPSKSSHDFLLSFMAKKYPQVTASVINRITNKLNDYIKNKSKTVLQRHTHVEYYRREDGLKYPYWSAVRKRMAKKYCDYYLLIRKNGNAGFTFELCRLGLNDNKYTECMLKLEWLSEAELWHADMYVSPYKFVGTAVRQSSNKLPEPVSLSIMRNSSVMNDHNQHVSLMLTGQISGWKTGVDQVLVNSEIFLWKLPHSFYSEKFGCDLITMSKNPKIKPLLGQPILEEKSSRILDKMFEQRWFTLSKMDGTEDLKSFLSEVIDKRDLPF